MLGSLKAGGSWVVRKTSGSTIAGVAQAVHARDNDPGDGSDATTKHPRCRRLISLFRMHDRLSLGRSFVMPQTRLHPSRAATLTQIRKTGSGDGAQGRN